MAKKKEEVPQEKGTNSKEILDNVLNQYKEDHLNRQTRVDWLISSGSLILDTYLGGGIKPSLLRMCGQNNEGKTAQSLEIMRQFLKTIPNSKGFWVVAEGRGIPDESRERCGLKLVYDPKDWDIGTIFVLESNIYELFINSVKNLVKNNTEEIKYCFVVDSIDGLTLKDDALKEITDSNMVAGVPKLSKKMLQNLSLNMFKFGHLMILISQVTASIRIDMYAPIPNRGGEFSGGNSLLHGADWIFEFQKTPKYEYFYDTPTGKWEKSKPDAKTIGKIAKVVIQKSAIETSRYHLVEYPIKFGRKPSGIWLEKEMIDRLLYLSLLVRKGSWLVWDDSFFVELQNKFPNIEKQVQGESNMTKYLEDNPEIQNFLYPKILVFSGVTFSEDDPV